ncbi:MAG TPA: RNA 2',3'-cyclic phosphodiesterase [Fimbriimonas sp.]|nr:RNA 2',3'-cyclic phosphodiesterase [Fimbriimonas sp.]
MNTFVALEIPLHAQEQIETYAHKVHAKLDRQGMKWVRKEKYHITLCFLGQLENPESVVSKVEAAVAGIKELKVEYGSINGFPDTKRPGVLWSAADTAGGELQQLQTAVAKALDVEDEFVPHVTLARMKPASTKLGHKLRDFMHSGPAPEVDSWTATTVSVIVTQADGSYQTLKSFALERK